MEDTFSELPRGWKWTKLGEIGFIASGGTPSTKDESNFGGDISWITPADLSNYRSKFISKGSRNLSEKGLKSSSAVLLPTGSILFSSRAPVGYVVIASNSISTNQGFKNLILHKGIFNEFVYYYLKGNKRLAESFASGTTFLEVSASKFAQIPIPLPPLPEQHRIVAKIEELITRLDAGVEALKKVKAQLKRYRQAVLKYPFEGKLTQEWREANKANLEPASTLLEKIRAEWKKLGQAKFNERPMMNLSDASELPEGWKWVSSAEIFWFVTSGSRGWAKYYSDTGPIFIRMANLNHDSIELDLQEIQKVQPPSNTEGTRTRVKANDILISITADIGMVGLVPDKFPDAYINLHVALARPVPSINVKYIAWFLASDANGQRQMSKLQRGATKIGLGLDDIRSINIPLPSRSEQDRIVDEIEHYFSITDEIKIIAEQTLKKSKRLRQSILKRAFEGKLVPQDPTDESAEKLLERIKNEKLSQAKEGKLRPDRRKRHDQKT